jgi:hypothetical protein
MRISSVHLAAAAAVLAISAAASAAILQDDPNYVAFEAEIGTIDNSSGTQPPDPNPGWVIDGVTGLNPMPPDPCGGSYVVNTDHTLSDPPPANDTLTYALELTNAGNYTVWFRVGYTTQDYEQTSDAANVNDSWYYQSGADGSAWTEDNTNSVKLDEWTWLEGPAGVSFSSTGPNTWVISSREDGVILDRVVLISEDNTDAVDGAYLDGLPNSIPEPDTLALLGLGGLALARRRRE